MVFETEKYYSWYRLPRDDTVCPFTHSYVLNEAITF